MSQIEDSLIRNDFPVTKNTAYMNNGAIAPTPLSTIKAVTDFLVKCSVDGPDSSKTSEYISGVLNELRERIAYLINCYKEEVIFVQSTTEGINIVANGMNWNENDIIVVRGGKNEHHANYFPWLEVANKNRLTIREVLADQQGFFDLAELERAAKGAKIITISHVLYNTGAVMPVEEVGKIARENNALLCVDGAQSVGAIPVDVRRISCDFMAFPSFKWLVGPLGLGILYCRKTAADLLSPAVVGGESAVLTDQNALGYLEPPAKYQAGFRNYPGVAGLEASARYVLRMGIENIRRKNMQVSEVIREGVARLPGSKIFSPEDGHRRSSILTFSTSVESSIVVRKLEEYGIVVAERDIGGGKKGVRASPHFFNSEEEASILVSHLKSISA